jgi:ketosteroid isomerase-like protein
MDASLSTEALLTMHLARFGAGDLEGILSEYTDDAVLLSADGALRGPAALRPLFAAMFEEFALPGVTFELLARRVEGECAYIAWRAETPRRSYTLGADTFIVRGGRIVYQTSAIASSPKA